MTTALVALSGCQGIKSLKAHAVYDYRVKSFDETNQSEIHQYLAAIGKDGGRVRSVEPNGGRAVLLLQKELSAFETDSVTGNKCYLLIAQSASHDAFGDRSIGWANWVWEYSA